MADTKPSWADGWFLADTGGGCTAWRRWLPGGEGYVLLTDGDYGAPSIPGYRPRASMYDEIVIPDAFVRALVALEIEVTLSAYRLHEDGDYESIDLGHLEGIEVTEDLPLADALAAADYIAAGWAFRRANAAAGR